MTRARSIGEILTGDVNLAGNVTATTQTAGNNTTRLATTAFVTTAVCNAEPFPSGTSMLFQQTSAPTGLKKQTTHNDKALRISESWGIHYNKDEYVAKHNHFPFAMSFNYCVSAPKGSSPFILEGEEIKSVPGRIIFFQAHRNHCTLPNESDGRCMIVGNVVYDPELLKP